MRIHTDECVQYHFQIPPDPKNWAARLESACRILESHPALPSMPLAYGLKTSDNSPIELDDRLAFLNNAIRRRKGKFCVVNGRQRRTVGLDLVDEGSVIVRDGTTRANASFGIFIQVPTIAADLRADLLASLGDVLEAYSGFHLIQKTWWLLHGRACERGRLRAGAPEEDAMRSFRELLEREGLELPVLETNYGVLESPLQPELPGWINYWSEETARYLGFPDEGGDQDLVARSMRTPRGAWLVHMTPDPLDLMNPGHLRVCIRLLERFPRLGLRQSPKASPYIRWDI